VVIVLASTYAQGWFILLPSDFIYLGENELAGAGFFANLLQLREANPTCAESGPFLESTKIGASQIGPLI
jgi:peptidoglycan/LPS O-acetylase OafA/YrhL